MDGEKTNSETIVIQTKVTTAARVLRLHFISDHKLLCWFWLRFLYVVSPQDTEMFLMWK